MTSVPITAVSVHTAVADLPADLLDRLDEGMSAVKPVAGFDASGFGAPHAAELWIDGEDAEDDPALRILGPHGRLLERVACDVHAAARLPTLPRERVGLHVATGMVDSPVAELEPAVRASLDDHGTLDLTRFFAGGFRNLHPLWPLSMLGNVAVGQIATDLDVRGDNLVVSSDAAAGVRAMLEARRAVRSATCAASITGGVAERVGPALLARMAFEGTLGNGPAAPLSPKSPGAAPGEGAALLVLGGPAPALAWLSGGATSHGSDGADAVARAVTRALADAKIVPAAVDLVFLGTAGAPRLDRAELDGIAKALGQGDRALVVPAVVGGDLGPATAAVNTTLAATCLAHGRTPRSLDPAAGPTHPAGTLPAAPASGSIDVALVTVLAANGSAGALVLERRV